MANLKILSIESHPDFNKVSVPLQVQLHLIIWTNYNTLQLEGREIPKRPMDTRHFVVCHNHNYCRMICPVIHLIKQESKVTTKNISFEI